MLRSGPKSDLLREPAEIALPEAPTFVDNMKFMSEDASAIDKNMKGTFDILITLRFAKLLNNIYVCLFIYLF